MQEICHALFPLPQTSQKPEDNPLALYLYGCPDMHTLQDHPVVMSLEGEELDDGSKKHHHHQHKAVGKVLGEAHKSVCLSKRII